MQATAESATAARSRRKETGGSTRTTTTTTPSKPRFSLSTVVNPRAQVHSAGTATREAAVAVPKDVSTKTTTARSSRTAKESVATPRATKSTTSSLGGHVQPTTKSVSTTRISKSRSPTTITTTTTTTTRRVALTTITMGPHHDREHRKLATANASAAAASALSAKTSSSSRKERTTRASNLAPGTAGVGRATMSRGGGRQTGVEPTVEHTNAITIPTTAGHNDDKNATTQQPTTTTTTTLLPALQMKGEEESVQDITSTPIRVAINSLSAKPSSPSSPPQAASTEIPHTLSSPISSPISSPTIAASRPKTPPPPYQAAILHNTPSSDIVCQTPDMPSITACSPTKESAPIIQERDEHTEVYLAMPPAVMATPLSKTEACPVAGSAQSPRIAKSMTATTVVSAPPTFLSGTPRIFRVMRETSSPRVLGVQQQQPRLTSQSEIKAGRDQERPAEVPTTPVPTTMDRTKSEDLAAEEPTEICSTLLTTLTPTTISDLVGVGEAPKPQPQPFRKNIWNGRMDKFTKTWSIPLSHEESIPTAQGNAPARTGILAAMGASVSRASLTKVKDPAVMRDLMVLAKERRASRTLCDGVAEDGASGFRSANSDGNQFRDRSRMQFEHGNDNDNDTPTTTTNFTTNHNNTCNSLSTSAPSGKITFEDKKAFLKTQEMRRRSNLHRSRSFNTVDLPYCPFPSSPSPAPAQDSLSIDTRPGFPWKGRAATATPPIPAMSVTIPLKVATVLQGMGYPINNTKNTSALSPLCSSPSPSPSPTWSTPSTPRIIPSSHSLSSISSFSSASTASSSVSSMSSASSASSKTLPLSFPDRLFQARSPSSSAGGAPVATMPRSFSPRPVRATSITGASGPSSYYSTQTYNNHQTPPQSSTMLPSLPSPALSLAVQERQHVSNRSVEGYFKPRLFSGSRSEDEQQVRQHALRPFERALVQQQQQQQQNKLTPPQRAAAAGVHALWSSSAIKSNSMPQLLPPPLSPSLSSPSSLSITDQEDNTTDSDRERRVRERSASTTSIDRPFFTEQVYSSQYSQEDQHSCLTTTLPVTQDISFLTKRLANLQLMDSLCPVSTPTPTQHLLPQQQQQQQQQQRQGGMDATWAMQIQLLLTHLAEQTDLEQESRLRPLPPPPRPHSLLLPEEEPEAGQKKKVNSVGVYKQVLTDWLLRLDQLSTITSPSTGSSLYNDHLGLKREVEKIRWQHNVPSKPNNRSK
ncbi:hypothetical protein KI688_002343 [Linnemannia hyalina]|uniref:Uncharacterized protein n=1 Tax=Linnemannia hyalina TaxID=64524 RepID=A0A9P7XS89_9FUNG|nr:hypothetical protein KI688_002343 [Linnemannia hyalina]